MKSIILYINILLLFNCAAQGTASGGPEDLEGPKLISINPPNKSINIPLDQKIILSFNELLDPVSIQNSIKISDNYKVKTKGRHIIITPEKKWEDNKVLSVYLSRKIRDYQRNIMPLPIQIAYSTGKQTILNTQINGKIIGYEKNSIIEIGLYNYPITNENDFIQKIEIDNNGFFNFNFIDYGKYVLGAIESKLIDFNKQIKRKKYAMLTSDYIHLNKSNQIEEVQLLFSEPLEKKEISSYEMIGQYDVNLIFNDLSEEKFIIDTLKFPGDSIKINIIKTNRLETYTLPEFSFLLPQVIDTISPKIIDYYNNDQKNIEFSEPIKIESGGILQKINDHYESIDFLMINSNKLLITSNQQEIDKIKILGDYIKDFSGNSMKDSINYITFKNTVIKEKVIGGNIIGSIKYSGYNPIIVEAKNIVTEETYLVQTDNLNFKLNNLKAGVYTLWAFEKLNDKKDDFTYFSGIWEPYHRAARFTIYADSIDVRARWDIEGININFN